MGHNERQAVMAEPATPTAEAVVEPSETEQAPTSETPKPRAEIPKEVSDALKKANKEAETLRKQLKEYEDRDKSDAEKLADRATAAEQRAAAAEARILRQQVALSKALPAELVDRLRGDTQEELEADADALLGLLAPKDDGETPFPDLGQGPRGGNNGPLGSDPLEKSLKASLGIR